MQVIGTTGWNKNLVAVEGAARGAQEEFAIEPTSDSPTVTSPT